MGDPLEVAVDYTLVRRMADGDAAALGELYDRYGSLLFSVGVRILTDRHAAEDLVQDVFLEAWRKAGEYDPNRASVRTWLILRARSRALDRVVSAPARRTVSMEDVTIPEPHAPSAGLDGKVDADRVQGALYDLSFEQRQVLELTFFQGLSSGDIARQVGVPVGTVKSRLRAGLAGMRAALGPAVDP